MAAAKRKDTKVKKPELDSKGRFFHFECSYPYGSYGVIDVQDHGNGLPITIVTIETDPQRSSSIGIDVLDAEVFRDNLTEAIDIAKRAGLDKR